MDNGYYIIDSKFFKLKEKKENNTILYNVRYKPSHYIWNNEVFNNIGGMGFLVFYEDGRFINYYNQYEDLSKVPDNSIFYGRYVINKKEITMEKVSMNQTPSKCYSRKIIQGEIISDTLILLDDGAKKYYFKE